MSDILEEKTPTKYFLSDRQLRGIVDKSIDTSSDEIAISSPAMKNYKVMKAGDSVNISHPNSKTRRGRIAKQKSSTLLTSPTIAVAVYDKKTKELVLRKLTPLECWKLQGFTESQFKLAEKINSNYQLYRQAGNSVSVPIIKEIGNKLEGE